MRATLAGFFIAFWLIILGGLILVVYGGT